MSRQITKFVTKRHVAEEEVLRERAAQFVKEVRKCTEKVGGDSVYNPDQSEFNLEFHSGRTLDFRGSKATMAEAQSLNSLTHSYTMQLVVSADGRLLPILLIVLQEMGGKFGPIVQEKMF